MSTFVFFFKVVSRIFECLTRHNVFKRYYCYRKLSNASQRVKTFSNFVRTFLKWYYFTTGSRLWPRKLIQVTDLIRIMNQIYLKTTNQKGHGPSLGQWPPNTIIALNIQSFRSDQTIDYLNIYCRKTPHLVPNRNRSLFFLQNYTSMKQLKYYFCFEVIEISDEQLSIMDRTTVFVFLRLSGIGFWIRFYTKNRSI
jgi:hypothetical protein